MDAFLNAPSAAENQSYEAILLSATQLAADAISSPPSTKADQLHLVSNSVQGQQLRWFVLPCEISTRDSTPPASTKSGQISLVPMFAAQSLKDGVGPDLIPSKTASLVDGNSAADEAGRIEDWLPLEATGEPLAEAVEQRKLLFPTVPRALTRWTGEAIRQFDMIREGDRVLLGLSGGKDSLSLLHVLLALQKRAPIKFELAAVTMNPQFPGFNPAPLIPYMESLGVTYFFESQELMSVASKIQPRSICSWCSRMKRGILYTTARREGYNVLALAQHLDDLAESFLMSAFHNGRLNTMKAHYTNQAGDVRVIRPFCMVREHMCRDFAKMSQLPIISENCPACFEAPKQRYATKKLLAQLEHEHPDVFSKLLNTMRPLMKAADSTDDWQ